MKRIIAILLLLALAFSFASCKKAPEDDPKDTEETTASSSEADAKYRNEELYSTIVAKNDYFELNAAEAAYMIYTNYGSYLSQMYNYLSLLGLELDPSKSLKEQYYDKENGTTWFDYFVSFTMDNIKDTIIVASLAKKNGFEPDENGLKSIQSYKESLERDAKTNGFSDINAYINEYLCKGVCFDAIENVIRIQLYASAYYDDFVAKLKAGYTDEDYEAYLKEDPEMAESFEHEYTRNVRHILFTTEKHETAEKALALAQDTYDKWKADGASLDDFIAIAKEKSEDGGSASNGGLYENVYEGQMVAEFEDWLFDDARKPGDTGIVETSYGAHIMYYVGESDQKSIVYIVQKSLIERDYKQHVASNSDLAPEVFKDKFNVIP